MDKDVEKILESWQLAEYIPIFAGTYKIRRLRDIDIILSTPTRF